MAKFSLESFLKSNDRYAKNVLLLYKRKGEFETQVGGCCTIISFLLLSYWLILNMVDTFSGFGKYSTSTSTKLVTIDNYEDS